MRCQRNRFILFPFIVFLISNFCVKAQNVVWANKLLEFTDKFQFENNLSEYVLGPPTIYPAINLEMPHDPYCEGYILNRISTKKKNIIRVGFPKPTIANQVLIGGVFNVGTIHSIYIKLKNGKEKLVYKLDKPAAKAKFRSFSVSMPINTVYGLKIVFDHSKVNNWNIIKGLGLINAPQPFEIAPNLYEDTTNHHNKMIVGEEVNSNDCFEFAPKIAPNGKSLYFVKECIGKDNQEIWFAEMGEKGKWMEAKNIGSPLNNNGHNFVVSISPEGNKLVLGNQYKPDGSDGGDGVSVSSMNEDGSWSLPKSIDIPNIENLNPHANYYMGPNGDVILLAIQTKKSVGDLDLYASLYNKVSNKWSPPTSLGLEINSAYAEDYPYIANDNTTLYFSSKGHIGYGGHDSLVTKRLDDSWTKWEKPKNLGPYINSKADDKGFGIANKGDYAFLNSAPFNSDLHHMDIFSVDLPKALRQNPKILVSGKLFDKKTLAPLKAYLSVKDDEENLITSCTSSETTGKYIVAVPFGKTYNIQVDAFDHFKSNVKLPLTDSLGNIELTKDFALMPFMDSGQVYKMENILFEFNRIRIKEDSYEELNKIAGWMKQQSKAKFEVSGHTDDKGSDALNQWLSEERSKAVTNYLLSRGINPIRLIAKGYGESMPIASNDTEEGRSLNRRVEIKTLTTDMNPKKANKGLANKRFKLSSSTVSNEKSNTTKKKDIVK